MASAAASLEASVRFVLKLDDQVPPDMEGAEFESSRTALDRTVARLATVGAETPAAQGELGFSCEWWPPN